MKPWYAIALHRGSWKLAPKIPQSQKAWNITMIPQAWIPFYQLFFRLAHVKCHQLIPSASHLQGAWLQSMTSNNGRHEQRQQQQQQRWIEISGRCSKPTSIVGQCSALSAFQWDKHQKVQYLFVFITALCTWTWIDLLFGRWPTICRMILSCKSSGGQLLQVQKPRQQYTVKTATNTLSCTWHEAVEMPQRYRDKQAQSQSWPWICHGLTMGCHGFAKSLHDGTPRTSHRAASLQRCACPLDHGITWTLIDSLGAKQNRWQKIRKPPVQTALV